MKFDPQKHHRRSIRLKGYDYSQAGIYYVTIVTQGRECIFGEIANKEMFLNSFGEIVQKWWDDIPVHFPNVETMAFVIMPNHVHGVIFITEDGKPTLGQIVGYFKYQTTKEMNLLDNKGVITKFWQRNYYERVVRNEKELKQKTDYILDNPSRWDDDLENPMKS